MVPGRSLDAYARQYARLLTDPCGAPLVHPVYPGGESGFLIRVDSVASYGGAVTESCGLIHWTPSYVNVTQTELVGAASSGPASSLVLNVNSTAPGRAFLVANASAARCVAACMKVSYPGAESTRSGRIHYGHLQAGTIDVGDTNVSVDSIAPLLQHYSRTPADVVEIIWRPGNADMEFNDPNAASSPTLRDRKTSLTFAWAGIPVSTGFTVHYTAVYEWMPKNGQGVSTNTNGKNSSGNTIDQVCDAIQATGFNWVRNAASNVGSGLGTGFTAGVIGTVSRYFGAMPAMSRNMPRIRM